MYGNFRDTNPHEFCTRWVTVFEGTKDHPLVKIFVVQRVTNLEEGENRSKVLQNERPREHNWPATTSETCLGGVDLRMDVSQVTYSS